MPSILPKSSWVCQVDNSAKYSVIRTYLLDLGHFSEDSGMVSGVSRANRLSVVKEQWEAFGRCRGPSLETGTLQPWPVRS